MLILFHKIYFVSENDFKKYVLERKNYLHITEVHSFQ